MERRDCVVRFEPSYSSRTHPKKRQSIYSGCTDSQPSVLRNYIPSSSFDKLSSYQQAILALAPYIVSASQLTTRSIRDYNDEFVAAGVSIPPDVYYSAVGYPANYGFSPDGSGGVNIAPGIPSNSFGNYILVAGAGTTHAQAIVNLAMLRYQQHYDTSHFTGTRNGRRACAAVVSEILTAVLPSSVYGLGYTVSAPTMADWFTKHGWQIIDDPSKAQPGDIALQNGRISDHNDTNAYDNHIGIVVRINGQLRILNNSTSRRAFVNASPLDFPEWTPAGPTRFYRPPQ